LSHKSPEIQHLEEEAEYGMRLPNGTEIWPPETFNGTDSTTAEKRHAIVEALRAAEVNLGKEPEQLLAEYQWIVRYRKTMVIVEWTPGFEVPLTDPHIIALPEPQSPINGEQVVPDWEAENTYSDGTEPEGRHSV
jgi:hypothetical protein